MTFPRSHKGGPGTQIQVILLQSPCSKSTHSDPFPLNKIKSISFNFRVWSTLLRQYSSEESKIGVLRVKSDIPTEEAFLIPAMSIYRKLVSRLLARLKSRFPK